MVKNYYRILEVSENAGFEEIKAAYRRLAKKYHPDKHFGDKHYEELFKEIQIAYSVLSDPGKRRRYDVKLKYGSTRTSSPRQPQPRPRPEQQRPKRPKPASSRKPPPETHEGKFIAFSFVAALGLLYLMILFSEEKTEPKLKGMVVSRPQQVAEQPAPPKKEKINTLPTDTTLGMNVYDPLSNNSLKIVNSLSLETIVCVVQAKAPHKVIRNCFFSYGDQGEIKNIPPGKYYLKVLYGRLRTSIDRFSAKDFQVFWSSDDKRKTYRLDSASQYRVQLNYYAPTEDKKEKP